jgi:hypothetical protein
MGGISKFLALRPADRSLILAAFGWLALFRAMILVFPFKKILGLTGLAPGESPGGSGVPGRNPSSDAQSRRVGWALRTASAHSPWKSACLVQALAGMRMLRRRGIPSTLYLGLARNASMRNSSDGIAAHAWLRCGDIIVTGGAGRERFTEISAFNSEREGS